MIDVYKEAVPSYMHIWTDTWCDSLQNTNKKMCKPEQDQIPTWRGKWQSFPFLATRAIDIYLILGEGETVFSMSTVPGYDIHHAPVEDHTSNKT